MRLLLLLALLAIPIPASAQSGYAYTGFYLTDPVVTYSCGSPLLQSAVATWTNQSGLIDGGCDDMNPDIYLRVRPIALGLFANSTMYAVSPSGPLAFCLIEVQPEHAWSPVLFLHEVGHCLGLAHAGGVMYEWVELADPPVLQEPDIAGIQSLYGAGDISPLGVPSYHMTVPMVTRTP